MLYGGFEQSIRVTKLMREAAGIVKRQSRFLRLFTTPARPKHRPSDEPGEDPDLHLLRTTGPHAPCNMA